MCNNIMRFIFKAKDAKGRIKEGRVEAASQELAVEALNENGLIPTYVEREKDVPKFVRDFEKLWEGVTQKELLIFFRQLSTLIGARVPIIHSLAAIGDQAENKYFRIIISEIGGDVEDGMSFSESLENHADIFPTVISSTIKAGEASGNLQESIDFVADNIEKNYRLSSKIKGALFYPAFVVAASLIMGFLTTVIVLPKLTIVIKDLNVEVPWYTVVVIAVGDFMRGYWWAVLIVIAAAIGGFIYYIQTENGKREWDQIKLKIPIAGKLYRYVYLSRFSSNLSMLLAGGISIIQSLNIVSDVVNNNVYKSIILRSADEVRSGGDMSTVFIKSEYIPPIVSRMIRIGEETGKIDESLKGIAVFYEQEADTIVRNLTSMIEPILIVVLGIGVAILVFSVLLPIYNIADKL